MDHIYLQAAYITHLVKENMDAIGGAFVSFLVAQDYNFGRFAAAMASGIFCAAYFSEWLVNFLPIPADMDRADALSIAGALWGLTGYVFVSTTIIFVQQKTSGYLTKSFDANIDKEDVK